ncbi:MAG: Lrp/AsnC family transcriptional regulator [Candidatus Bathyarchaeia archaeon]
MVSAFVLIKVGTGDYLDFAKSAKEQIAKIEGVKAVHFVFGRYDLVARVETPTLEELARIISDKMRGVPGVLSTESLIIGF